MSDSDEPPVRATVGEGDPPRFRRIAPLMSMETISPKPWRERNGTPPTE